MCRGRRGRTARCIRRCWRCRDGQILWGLARSPPERSQTPPLTTDVLALVGGDEFKPGNEEQDRMLVAAAKPGPAFVVPTAAARQRPEESVEHATAWFKKLGLELQELPVLTRTNANSKEIAERASSGGFFYLVGGDPGLVG